MWYNMFFDDLYIEWQEDTTKSYGHDVFLVGESLKDSLKISPEKNILDLGCGAGYFCEYFANQGNRVIGIDISNSMLKKARKVSPTTTFINADFSKEICLDERFDFIFCMNTSFGYFGAEMYPEFILNIQNLLSENGIFVLDLMNPYSFKENFKPNILFETKNYKIEQISDFDEKKSLC